MHISVQTRAVGHEKVISYPKRRDIITGNARYPSAYDNASSVHTGAVDWFMEYATPTYVLVNNAYPIALGRAFCRRTRYLGKKQQNLFSISEISARSTRILQAHEISEKKQQNLPNIPGSLNLLFSLHDAVVALRHQEVWKDL
jgi:hypothetical protein